MGMRIRDYVLLSSVVGGALFLIAVAIPFFVTTALKSLS